MQGILKHMRGSGEPDDDDDDNDNDDSGNGSPKIGHLNRFKKFLTLPKLIQGKNIFRPLQARMKWPQPELTRSHQQSNEPSSSSLWVTDHAPVSGGGMLEEQTGDQCTDNVLG
jgi:hypothetical protein